MDEALSGWTRPCLVDEALYGWTKPCKHLDLVMGSLFFDGGSLQKILGALKSSFLPKPKN